MRKRQKTQNSDVGNHLNQIASEHHRQRGEQSEDSTAAPTSDADFVVLPDVPGRDETQGEDQEWSRYNVRL
jgi:hypothetical protein